MEDQFSQPMQRARAAVRALHRLETLTRTSSARRARLSDANQPPLDGGAAVPLDVNAHAGESAERASSWNPGELWEHTATFPDRVPASHPRLAVPAMGLLAHVCLQMVQWCGRPSGAPRPAGLVARAQQLAAPAQHVRHKCAGGPGAPTLGLVYNACYVCTVPAPLRQRLAQAAGDLCACCRMRWCFWRAEELRLRMARCLHPERHPRTVCTWLSPQTRCLTAYDVVRRCLSLRSCWAPGHTG